MLPIAAMLIFFVACQKDNLEQNPADIAAKKIISKETVAITYHYQSEVFKTKAEVIMFDDGKSTNNFVEGDNLDRLKGLLEKPNLNLYLYKPDEVYICNDDKELAKIHKSLNNLTTIIGLSDDSELSLRSGCVEGCPIPALKFICQPEVWMYRHCGYDSQMYYHAVPLSGRVENNWVGSANNDQISSIIAKPGQFRSAVNNQIYNVTTIVRLYEHANFGGRTATINANWLGQCTPTAFYSCLTSYGMGCCNNFNDETSSYKILLCY